MNSNETLIGLTDEISVLGQRIKDLELSRAQSEERLFESEAKYRTIVESSLVAVHIVQDRFFRFSNRRWCEMLGYQYAEVVDKLTPLDLVYPEDRGIVEEDMRKRLSGDMSHSEYEIRVVRKDGKIITARIFESMMSYRGRPAVLGTAIDITRLKKAEEDLRINQSRLSEAMDLAHIAYWEVSPENNSFILNDPFYSLCGTTAEQEGGYRMSYEEFARRFVHPNDWPSFHQFAEQSAAGENAESIADFEHRIIRRDGEVRNMLVRRRIVRDKSGRVIKRYGANQDITDRKLLEEKLSILSIMDDLTGLYNRRGFFFLAEQQLKVAERTGKKMLVFFADVDGLKSINDTFGHREGDKALLEMASILKETFRESDIIGRMGGDEFAVAAFNAVDENAAVLGSRLEDSIARYNHMEKRKYHLSLSVGVVCFDPENPRLLDELIAEADKLMYEKKKGKYLCEG